MSESNRSHILDYLFRHGVSSRAEIAQVLALTPAAITKITARLIDAGIIRETGDIEGRKKRRSIGLSLANDTIHVIGVKFARSIVQIAVFDLAGTQLSLQTLPPVTERTIRTTLDQIRTGIQHLLDEDRHIIAVGMAVP
ncbi:MAG: winged helix-turn-helix transcriptional regulator, partial [Bifidobacterium mongoliense]|nr:winged helix-turn-helix transcriptional regulator [Bifidobacterium mongoliense]